MPDIANEQGAEDIMGHHLMGTTVVVTTAVLGLAGAGTASAYPNLYEGLGAGACVSYDRANNLGGPADCDSVAANYRIAEIYQLTPETSGMECTDPMAALSYHHRTDEGVRLALYCLTNNFRVGDCWNLTDIRERRRVDCGALEPETERLTAVFEGVTDATLCHNRNNDAIVWDKPQLTVCVESN